ncbi:DUF2339 domain-containing protein [Prosthecobacter fusiformis]|uniref:DUF2339 domain-containing protein n=1 Tax=Prosthecobacter fusiformis TaxID=48464 RepID=UPI0014152399|nr:DUF2339 domain-containing protein [Prosthecobacter fusiformis]
MAGPGIAWYLASEARKESQGLKEKVNQLRAEVERLKADLPSRSSLPPIQEEVFIAPPPPQVVTQATVRDEPPVIHQEPTILPPALPPPVFERIAETPVLPPLEAAGPPKIPAPKPMRRPVKAARPEISLEQFLGVKLFAWIGGLALFLGIVFFVKYAFERNLISPALRTGIGFLIGGGLVVTGIIMRRSKDYAVLAQTLAATGVLILYGVTYAAHALYHFPAFGTLSTFVYMSLITTGAFVLSVRMEAPVIAVLGMAGGFLTPIFVNTGVDNPLGLFGYLLLIDLGLMAVAKKRGWYYLIACGAAGTLLLEAGWFMEWFWKGEYHLSAKIWIPVTVHVFFPALFAGATWWLQARSRDTVSSAKTESFSLYPAYGGLALAAWSFIVAFLFLEHDYITSRPVVLNGFLFALNAAVLLQIWVQPRVAMAQWLAALLSFVHLAVWSSLRLTEATLMAALLSYLVFGLMHTGFALLAMRKRPETMQAQQHGIWLGPVAVLLVLGPMFALPEVPWLIWPTVLLLNLMTIAVAGVTLALAPVLLALCVTLLAVGFWLFRLDPLAGPWSFLLTLGGFALVFAAAGAVLSARVRLRKGGEKPRGSEWLTSLEGQLPMASASLPFILLIIATYRLNLVNPTPVFSLGLLLCLGLLVLMRLSRLPALGMAALVCMWLLEYVWMDLHYTAEQPWVALGWFLGVASLFAGYPFLWRSRFQEVALPWVISAITWLLQGFLIYKVCDSLPRMKEQMGWVPALLALPPLVSLSVVLKMPLAGENAIHRLVRNTQLAWFGGVALAFITLIFPIQFNEQWITLGWAMEGAALCWLYTRVPHDGLRRVGVGLLTATFIRLALNPAVLSYQERSETPIWNWFLYAYGTAALAMFAAAWWLAPPRDRMGEVNLRGLLWSYGGILLFLLVNIQIADYFTPAGEAFISTQWGGDFARSMTFSIAWALFALGLLVIGFRVDAKGARYAGIALMGVTLMKLFFHDLANIESIYRIGALIVVAIIALGASFLYQRFYARQERDD